MRFSVVVFLAAGASMPGQVKFRPEDIAVNIDGKPFTVFHYGTEVSKPHLAPLRSASGKIVTRHFPNEEGAGESHDHLHHRGLRFSYDDVNHIKFWENDPSYKRGAMGIIAVRKTEWKEGEHSGTLKASMDWLGPDGKALLHEDRDMVFYADPKLRTIDFVITLTAVPDITLGDTKEGAFAIRLADNFSERNGVKIVNSEGQTGMVNVWGKRSNWVDYSTDVDGEMLGVAMFDSPQNPR